jgi:hypothetical protein
MHRLHTAGAGESPHVIVRGTELCRGKRERVRHTRHVKATFPKDRRLNVRLLSAKTWRRFRGGRSESGCYIRR